MSGRSRKVEKMETIRAKALLVNSGFSAPLPLENREKVGYEKVGVTDTSELSNRIPTPGCNNPLHVNGHILAPRMVRRNPVTERIFYSDSPKPKVFDGIYSVDTEEDITPSSKILYSLRDGRILCVWNTWLEPHKAALFWIRYYTNSGVIVSVTSYEQFLGYIGTHDLFTIYLNDIPVKWGEKQSLIEWTLKNKKSGVFTNKKSRVARYDKPVFAGSKLLKVRNYTYRVPIEVSLSTIHAYITLKEE